MFNCNSEICTKIRQFLTKLQKEISWLLFMAHGEYGLTCVLCTAARGIAYRMFYRNLAISVASLNFYRSDSLV